MDFCNWVCELALISSGLVLLIIGNYMWESQIKA
jgi:hypothetical protein